MPAGTADRRSISIVSAKDDSTEAADVATGSDISVLPLSAGGGDYGMATGARGATMSFTRDGQGDVLLAWETEAFYSLKESGEGKYEIVTPSISIFRSMLLPSLAELPHEARRSSKRETPVSRAASTTLRNLGRRSDCRT